jgi:hypothetical protein
MLLTGDVRQGNPVWDKARHVMKDKSVLHHVSHGRVLDFDMSTFYLILIYSPKACYLRFITLL